MLFWVGVTLRCCFRYMKWTSKVIVVKYEAEVTKGTEKFANYWPFTSASSRQPSTNLSESRDCIVSWRRCNPIGSIFGAKIWFLFCWIEMASLSQGILCLGFTYNCFIFLFSKFWARKIGFPRWQFRIFNQLSFLLEERSCFRMSTHWSHIVGTGFLRLQYLISWQFSKLKQVRWILYEKFD